MRNYDQFNVVANAGIRKRCIARIGQLCFIGCFEGTRAQAEEAIERNYKDDPLQMDAYLEKVRILFEQDLNTFDAQNHGAEALNLWPVYKNENFWSAILDLGAEIGFHDFDLFDFERRPKLFENIIKRGLYDINDNGGLLLFRAIEAGCQDWIDKLKELGAIVLPEHIQMRDELPGGSLILDGKRIPILNL